MTPIRSINSAGKPSASFYVVNPSGSIVSLPSALTDAQIAAGSRPELKPGFRFATAADLDNSRKAEQARAASEPAV